MSSAASPSSRCPPHHWYSVEETGSLSRWKCLRCGQQRTQQRPRIVKRDELLTKYSTWSVEEMIAIGAYDDE